VLVTRSGALLQQSCCSLQLALEKFVNQRNCWDCIGVCKEAGLNDDVVSALVLGTEDGDQARARRLELVRSGRGSS